MNFSKEQTLLYSSSDNSSHHGVGIIMKNELLPRLQWYRCLSSCIISILPKQPCSNGSHTANLAIVISYYAPTNAVTIRDESVREDCYDTVEDTAPRIAILP